MGIFNLLGNAVLTSSSISNSVATAVNGVDMSGILNEVLSLLPVVLPILIAFLGVRKGISFLIGSLRRA